MENVLEKAPGELTFPRMDSLYSRWSSKALRFFSLLPDTQTVADLYWHYWSTGGKEKGAYNGFKKAPGIGFVTYNEIRNVLSSCGYPDLSDEMFDLKGFCPICCQRSFLEKLIYAWRDRSPEEKRTLRAQMQKFDQCDGH